MFDTANIDNIYDTAIQNEKIFLEKKPEERSSGFFILNLSDQPT